MNRERWFYIKFKIRLKDKHFRVAINKTVINW